MKGLIWNIVGESFILFLEGGGRPNNKHIHP
jgi:hypothetical protein